MRKCMCNFPLTISRMESYKTETNFSFMTRQRLRGYSIRLAGTFRVVPFTATAMLTQRSPATHRAQHTTPKHPILSWCHQKTSSNMSLSLLGPAAQTRGMNTIDFNWGYHSKGGGEHNCMLIFSDFYDSHSFIFLSFHRHALHCVGLPHKFQSKCTEVCGWKLTKSQKGSGAKNSSSMRCL